jgi:hypothetical protein
MTMNVSSSPRPKAQIRSRPPFRGEGFRFLAVDHSFRQGGLALAASRDLELEHWPGHPSHPQRSPNRSRPLSFHST